MRNRDSWPQIIKTYFKLKSIRATADALRISKSGVEYALKESGTPRFKRNRKGAENSIRKAILKQDEITPSRQIRDKKIMHDLYVTQRKSAKEIGEILGIDSKAVAVGLEQCGITKRTLSETLKGIPRPNSQGSKNHNWKGGLTGWRKLARGRLNEHFVRPIMERDNFVCQWCGSKKKIVVHHHKRSFMEIVAIVENRVDRENVEVFVSEIVKEHSLSDGITLCKVCHDKYHKENGK